MPEHPARAILVRLSGAGRSLLDCAGVLAMLDAFRAAAADLLRAGGDRPCPDAALADLRSVVLPLTVPDLPMIVWCRSTRLLEMAAFLADRGHGAEVVLDSASAPDAAGILQRAREVVERGGHAGRPFVDPYDALARDAGASVREPAKRRATVLRFERGGGVGRLAPTFRRCTWERGFAIRWAAVDVNPALHLSRAADEDFFAGAVDGRRDCRRVGAPGRPHGGHAQRAVAVHQSAAAHRLSADGAKSLGIVRHDPVFEKTLASAAQLAHPIDK